jgi:hypothetical protein
MIESSFIVIALRAGPSRHIFTDFIMRGIHNSGSSKGGVALKEKKIVVQMKTGRHPLTPSRLPNNSASPPLATSLLAQRTRDLDPRRPYPRRNPQTGPTCTHALRLTAPAQGRRGKEKIIKRADSLAIDSEFALWDLSHLGV